MIRFFIYSLLVVTACFAQSRRALILKQPQIIIPQNCDSVNDSSLVAYWRADDANDAKSTNHLTEVNGSTTVAGKITNAWSFTAASSMRKYIADNPNVSIGSGVSFSVGAWVKANAVDGLIHGIAGQTDTYGLFLWSNNKFLFSVNAYASSVYSTVTPIAGQWYHVVGTYDSTSGTAKLYVNGATPDTTTGVSDTTDTANFFIVGAYASTYFWDGAIDEVFLTKRALTAAEVSALFNTGLACLPAGL